MEYGIFRHGPLKTFLTRGFLRSIFKPLFYSKSDNIQANFVEVVNDLVIKIENGIKNKNKLAIIAGFKILVQFFDR